ncbi:hypothetical protein IPP75_00670 [Candidatus Saccharibacteria bacterium]|nr:MAG: hypothetical protein IPP75_00670 [Candidatus Saccharibacteria bacterium]
MSQDEFKKLFQYIEGFRTEVSQQFEANTRKQDETIAAVAELGGHLRDYRRTTGVEQQSRPIGEMDSTGCSSNRGPAAVLEAESIF